MKLKLKRFISKAFITLCILCLAFGVFLLFVWIFTPDSKAAQPGTVTGLSEEWVKNSADTAYSSLNRDMQIELMAECLRDAATAYAKAGYRSVPKEFGAIQAGIGIAFFEYRAR